MGPIMKVKARKCPTCGHHEIVAVRDNGEEIPLTSGMEVILYDTGKESGDCQLCDAINGGFEPENCRIFERIGTCKFIHPKFEYSNPT